MAINKNHEFEELNGIKCAIVEKNCNSDRVSFLKELLEWNKYTVVVVDSPAPKAAPAAAAPASAVPATPAAIEVLATSSIETKSEVPLNVSPNESKAETPTTLLPPTTYTVGVTDLTFNAINAIFGRILKTKDNRIVTQAYWKQQVDFSNDEVPYFEMKKV